MASSLVLVAFCLVSACLAAPQLSVQPQLIRQGPYLQPQLVRGNYFHPQQYSRFAYPQPAQNYFYNSAPQAAYSAAPQYQPVYRSDPQLGARSAAILRQAQDATLDGAYSYGFESENGIALQTNAGPLTPVGPEDAVQTVTGSFSYTAPDGTPITTNWISDENGFRAEGAHLPRAPENNYRTA